VSHRKRSFKGGAVVVWAAAIAGLLLTPGSALDRDWLKFPFRHLFDSVVHGVVFFILAILLYRALAHGRWPAIATTVVGCLLYAILLEVLQRGIPGRSFEMVDIVAAFLGILAALVPSLLPRSTA